MDDRTKRIIALGILATCAYWLRRYFMTNTGNFKKDFVNKIYPYAQAVANAEGWRTDLIITQAAHESNWGRSELAAKYNNLFGFTGESAQKAGEPTVNLPTTEYKGTAAYSTNRPFKTYNSWLASIQDWARLLKSYPKYGGAVAALKAGDYSGFFTAMGSSGYATDPSYGTKLAAVFNDVTTALV